MIRRFFACLAFALFAITTTSPIHAQGTAADYERSATAYQRTRDKVFLDSVDPHWTEDGDRFWYRQALPDGRQELVVVNPDACLRGNTFDAKALGLALKHPLDWIAQSLKNPSLVRIKSDKITMRFDPESGRIEPGDPPPPDRPRRGRRDRRSGSDEDRPESTSPDGKYVVFLKDHDIYIREIADEAVTQLTEDGDEADAYRRPLLWSPDSRHLLALKTSEGEDREVYLIESSPRDQVQPKLHSYDYRKPGDRLPITRPHLFDVEAKQEIEISTDRFENPWSTENFRWSEDSSRFTFLFNERGHQNLRLLAVEAESGEVSTLIDEHSDTFIDYSQKLYRHDVESTDEIIWASERSGYNHLYLIDGTTGVVKNPITSGDWVVRGVDRVDEEKRQIWLRVLGIHPGQDPYYVHHARVDFDGSNFVILTGGDGTHEIAMSPDDRFLIDTYSRVDQPPITELRSAEDGSLIRELERADASALIDSDWRMPERFVAKGRDGVTDIYGVIFCPSNFDPSKKYPVIEQIYAGPQDYFVPKKFSAFHGPQALAELGFILVQIDGMGTNWRSKAFHDVCWKDLADAGLPDRIAWLKAAAETRPFMDLDRVGIYGGSAGGQNALGGLLFHGDFYKVGVADCGCHDNRMDKIWWNEAWMGWPVGPEYAASSNVVNADKLTGKLMLTVGELDRNVDPASTMQVVDALIRADKDFDLIVFPGSGHGAGGSRYGRRRMQDFFVRHLLSVEPRAD